MMNVQCVHSYPLRESQVYVLRFSAVESPDGKHDPDIVGGIVTLETERPSNFREGGEYYVEFSERQTKAGCRCELCNCARKIQLFGKFNSNDQRV
jgi:hypothetical protein